MKRALIATLAGLAVLGAACTSKPSEAEQAETGKLAAYDVCQQFVKDRLRAPGTASFPNFFEDDGEVTVRQDGDGVRTAAGKTVQPYTITAHVDAENGFGGEVRNGFLCVVETADGEHFKLRNLVLDEDLED